MCMSIAEVEIIWDLKYLFDLGIAEKRRVRKCTPRRKEGYLLKSATDKTLRVKDSVSRIHGSLVFCGIANQSFLTGEGHI